MRISRCQSASGGRSSTLGLSFTAVLAICSVAVAHGVNNGGAGGGGGNAGGGGAPRGVSGQPSPSGGSGGDSSGKKGKSEDNEARDDRDGLAGYQIEYDLGLRLLTLDPKPRVVRVDPTTGLATTARAGAEPLRISGRACSVGPDFPASPVGRIDAWSMKWEAFDAAPKDPMPFSGEFDEAEPAWVGQRVVRVNRGERSKGWDVSVFAAAVQSACAHSIQVETRSCPLNGLEHGIVVEQRLGDLVTSAGYPAILVIETLNTYFGEQVAHEARVARVLRVHPASADSAARVVEHFVGETVQPDGRLRRKRSVHVTAEFRADGFSVGVLGGAMDGQPWAWDRVFRVADSTTVATVEDPNDIPRIVWEREFHPLSPSDRGLQTFPVVWLLTPLPTGKSKWSGAAPPLNSSLSTDPRTRGIDDAGAWTPSIDGGRVDVGPIGGCFRFDAAGNLIAVSPFRDHSKEDVAAYFAQRLASCGDDAFELEELEHQILVITQFVADFSPPAKGRVEPDVVPPNLAATVKAIRTRLGR